MKTMCLLKPKTLQRLQSFSLHGRMIQPPHVGYNSILFPCLLALLIHHVMFICLILSHWPCLLCSALARAVYSFNSDSVFADQTRDHRKVSSFPSLFDLFGHFSCVPSVSNIILLFIPLLSLLLAALNYETSQDTAVDIYSPCSF